MRMSLGMRGQSSGRGFAEFERFELSGRWRMLAASSDEIASMKPKKKGHYPLLVGKKLIMFDTVSGGLNTVKDGSHNFRNRRSGKS
jgi:hypothetical protein